MGSPSYFKGRLESILGVAVRRNKAKLGFEWSTSSEAKGLIRRLRRMQAELRFLKRDLGHRMSIVRAEFARRSAAIGTGFGTGLMIGFFGRKTSGKYNALKRDDLRRQRIRELEPYENVARLIDRAIFEIGTVKTQAEEWLRQNK